MRPRATRIASFAAAAGALGTAAVLNRACPGSCGPCSQCAVALVPTLSAVGAVGTAFVGSAFARRGGRGKDGVGPE